VEPPTVSMCSDDTGHQVDN